MPIKDAFKALRQRFSRAFKRKKKEQEPVHDEPVKTKHNDITRDPTYSMEGRHYTLAPRYCPNCGKEVLPHAHFCEKCLKKI